jgi:hypothetical protein
MVVYIIPPDTQSYPSFGWVLQPTTPHNCYRASHISLWYKIVVASSGDSMKLYMLDDSSCEEDCTCPDNLHHYLVFYHELPPQENNLDWQEFKITVPPHFGLQGGQGLLVT